MHRDGLRQVSTALRIVLGCVALAGCGREAPAAPASKAPAPAGLASTAAPETTPAPKPPLPAAPAPPAPAAAAKPALAARADGHAAASSTPPAQPSGDRYSVLDVEIAAPKPFVLKLRVEPELAPDLASAKLKLEQPTFTVAGRSIDVSGGRLSVCGIGLGPIEDRSVLTLQRGEVRVDDVYRGPLPAAVETH